MIELISIGINAILLIVFIMMASSIGSIKRTLIDMMQNGYQQYTCGHADCKSKFWGKQPNCPSCKKKITW